MALVTVWFAAVALGLAATPASAQDAIDQFRGQTIASVGLEVEGQPDHSPVLVGQLQTVQGRPLKPEDVRATINNLMRVGRYDDVTVLATPGAGGVNLIYAIVPRHPVDKVSFTGSLGLPESELQRIIRQQFSGPPPATRAVAAAAVIEAALKDDGFLRPSVKPDIVPTHNPDRATMVFQIDAGARARLGQVVITSTGPAKVAESSIANRTGATPGAPYSPRAIGVALDAMVDELRQRDYYEASRSIRPADVSADGSTVNIELVLSSGPLFKIKFANPQEFPKGTLDDLVPVKQQRSVDKDLLEDSERHIVDLLRRDGYTHAEVTHTSEATADQTVVTFTVRRGLRYRTAEPDVTGNTHVSTADLMALLEPATSPFFDQSRLDRWRFAVLGKYRGDGYAFAEVTFDQQDLTSSMPPDGLGHVRMRLQIAEGPETRVGPITFHTAKAISETELRGLMRLRTGALFLRTAMDADQEALQTAYLNRGFRAASVSVVPIYSTDHTTAALPVEIAEGPQTIIDRIVPVGNGPIKESLILSQMAVHLGEPYSLADEFESRRRLAELQLFRTIDFSTAPMPGSDTHVELIVRVEPAAATSVAIGGGLAIAQQSISNDAGAPTQQLQIAPKASFDITRRNLFGRNRQISVSSSVTFRPNLSGTIEPASGGPGEYHFGGTYRAPQAFGRDIDLAVGTTFEKAPRTTLFTFTRRTLHADLQRRTDQRINIIGRYTLEESKVFFGTGIDAADLLLIDRLFPQVRLSTFSGGIVRDRRDDLLDPAHGTLLSVEGDLAARAIGSQVGLSKTLIDVSGFTQVAGTNDRSSAGKLPRVVLAARVELGLAHGFPRDVTVIDAQGVAQTQHVEDLPASQRFFAGGSTTVRGFDIDQLGVPEVLDPNGLSNGGNGLLLLNGEVRTTVLHDFLRKGGDFGLVGFTDAGNVFARASDVRLNRLLETVGIGARWKSPIGPLRVDYAYKLNPRTINGALESRTGWSFSIGEAF